MPYAVRTFECEGCGAEIRKRAANGAKVTCIDCNIQRSVIEINQLRNKSGAFYQKWVTNLSRAMSGEQAIAEASDVIERLG